jgi:hypothetical protein
MKPKLTLRERFLEKVDEQWQWKGAKNKDGYGQIKIDGVQMGAHVISYELFVGTIPPGAFVLHSCDDPGCVNPDHLHLGDHQKNMDERKAHGHYANVMGANNPMATLKDEQIAEIRRLYATGNYSQQELAKMFNSHQTSISQWVTWKHR